MPIQTSLGANLTTQSDIRLQECPRCYLCGAPGNPLYDKLSDRLFGVPGSWNLSICPQDNCRLVWLNPRPIDEDIPKLYENYYTHGNAPGDRDRLARLLKRIWRLVLTSSLGYELGEEGRFSRWLGMILARLGPLREAANSSVFWLSPRERGRLLDVGCGAGEFLLTMRSLGWDVAGVEPDPSAAAVAGRKLPVRVGTLEEARYPNESFDVITLSHVIEHLPDPIRTLKECGRILRPGGRVLVYTPNMASMGQQKFGRYWAPWDPPRHLMVFNPASLRRAAESAGLSVTMLSTLSRMAWWSARVSQQIRVRGTVPGGSTPFHPWYAFRSAAFRLSEYRRSRKEPVGEELFLIATK